MPFYSDVESLHNEEEDATDADGDGAVDTEVALPAGDAAVAVAEEVEGWWKR